MGSSLGSTPQGASFGSVLNDLYACMSEDGPCWACHFLFGMWLSTRVCCTVGCVCVGKKRFPRTTTLSFFLHAIFCVVYVFSSSSASSHKQPAPVDRNDKKATVFFFLVVVRAQLSANVVSDLFCHHPHARRATACCAREGFLATLATGDHNHLPTCLCLLSTLEKQNPPLSVVEEG